ncbi:MAG: hypothetical protein M5R40_27460 [Anaerolineae bacterium]|nr:hypothetical protein [Anaerolineae bacterium]
MTIIFFPKAYLDATTKLDARDIDSILNRTLIDRQTNKTIGKNPPSKYLQMIERHLESGKLDVTLASHYLPTGKESCLWRDDFEAFRNQRADELYNLIIQATS